jgi:membrane protease YdiL (CAAX protease family)
MSFPAVPLGVSLFMRAYFLAAFFAVWTAWVCLLTRYPVLDDGVVRAAVRVAVWVLPALLFVRVAEGPPVLARIGLRAGAVRGVLAGLAGFGVLLLAALAEHGTAGLRLKIPTDAATWLNPLLSAPLAEEILFRGLVFRLLREKIGAAVAIPASAALFALAHLPYWAISGDKAGAALAVGLGSVFLLGALFAALFHWSRSLWAPLVCHFLNNLIILGLGG